MDIKTIILDLDGVITDFDLGVSQKYPVPNFGPENVTGWGTHINAVCGYYGLSKSQFWQSLGYAFWSNLPFTPEAYGVLSLCEQTGCDVVICTSPTFGGCDGKQNWIAKHLPGFFMDRKYLIGPAKAACAGPYSLLIDDSTKNCEDFNKAGGRSCLFPRRWNSNDGLDPVLFLRETLTHWRAL